MIECPQCGYDLNSCGNTSNRGMSWAKDNLWEPDSLEMAISQRNAWRDTAAQHLRNEEYYRGLVIKIGAMLGPEAYISDDGSIQDSVLCTKVPELVTKLVASRSPKEPVERSDG